jgi:hypothetical protein
MSVAAGEGDMDGILRLLHLLGIEVGWPSWLPYPGNLTLLPDGTLLLMIIMSLVGATILQSFLPYSTWFNSAVNVSALFIGGLVANVVYGWTGLHLLDATVSAVLVANLGMAIAGLLVIIAYRNAV